MARARHFRRGFWGYKRAEVDGYLSELEGRFAREREALSLQQQGLEGEARQLHARVEQLEQQLAQYRQQEQAIAQILVDAQLRAAEVEDRARAEVEAMKEEIIAEVAGKRVELRNLRDQMTRFKQDFALMLDNYKSSLNEEPGETEDPTETVFGRE